LEVSKLYEAASSWNLDQKTWSQENEKHHRHKNWPPISHILLLLLFECVLGFAISLSYVILCIGAILTMSGGLKKEMGLKSGSGHFGRRDKQLVRWKKQRLWDEAILIQTLHLTPTRTPPKLKGSFIYTYF